MEPVKQETKSINNDNSAPVQNAAETSSNSDPNEEINAYSAYLNDAVDKNVKVISSANND